MNRRTFCGGLLCLGIAPALPTTWGHAEITWQPMRDGDWQAKTDVRWHATDQAADRFARTVTVIPEGAFFEYYPGGSTPVDLTEEIASIGRLSRIETVFGYAAQKGTLYWGVFRRGQATWEVRVAEGDGTAALDIASFIAAVESLAPGEWPTSVRLRALLPTADAFGEPVEETDPTYPLEYMSASAPG